MQHSFLQRVFMTIVSGAVAASLIMFYQTFVARAIYENGDGWREVFKDVPKSRR